MKRQLLFPLLFTCLFASAQTDSSSFSKNPKPHLATVHTIDGRTIKGLFYKMDDNNIYLLPAKTKTIQLTDYKSMEMNDAFFNINIAQINTIATQKKNAGLKGALIGLGVGAAAGAIMGFARGDDPLQEYSGFPLTDIFVAFGNAFAMTAEEKATTGALTGAITGALTGFLIGKLAKKKFNIGGRKENYRDLQGDLMKRLLIK